MERKRYQLKKAEGTRQTQTKAMSGPPSKRPRDMSPNELRHYKAAQRRHQRHALSTQKKTAIK